MSAPKPLNTFEQLVQVYLDGKMQAIRSGIEPKAMEIIHKAVCDIDALCPDKQRDFDYAKQAAAYHQALSECANSLKAISAKISGTAATDVQKMIVEIGNVLKNGGAS